MFDEHEGTAGHSDRRQFLTRTAATGAGALVGASALAVTTYTNIIDKAPFFKRLEGTTRAT